MSDPSPSTSAAANGQQAPTPGESSENQVPHYLGALLVSALVIGLAFFVKDAPTKWIVVIVGIVMFVSVLLAFGKEMAGRGTRR
jgi:hypothetical protein